MKKIISVFLALALLLLCSCAACAESPFVKTDGESVVFSDDGSGEAVVAQDMEKRVLATARDIQKEIELNGAIVTIKGLQVSNVVVRTSLEAAMLGIKQNSPYTLISLDLSVENTGTEDLYLNAADAFVVTNEKEQVSCAKAFAEGLNGLLLPGAEAEDQLYFFCGKTSIFDFEFFRFYWNAPKRENGEPIGDRIVLAFSYVDNGLSEEVKETIREAEDLLNTETISRQELSDTLSFLGCGEEAIREAIEWLAPDFEENATAALQDWIDTIHSYNEPEEKQAEYLSYDFLYDMLTETSGFTKEEASVALARCGVTAP